MLFYYIEMANNLTVLKTVVKKLAKLGALGVILAFVVTLSFQDDVNAASCMYNADKTTITCAGEVFTKEGSNTFYGKAITLSPGAYSFTVCEGGERPNIVVNDNGTGLWHKNSWTTSVGGAYTCLVDKTGTAVTIATKEAQNESIIGDGRNLGSGVALTEGVLNPVAES